ncbi:Aldolase-type TIM barrel [Penicillium expansum]|uniref:chanoclavine-I aldehyde reductase n=1 Tax=Penicillium expansum TaxID=27334 RepID=A0A0A2J4L2_PENEN|nr:Aldolase-type TIM barrel [Penicillium expansum]KGO46504.1 Aldolase-type TIM barrel [Penicillium expansum]KGO50259.1 Aldolase-type TIM barrel [Penicillium expansum]KGO69866.1 Aldolase-type TIM barrel [Penicillium expansum]
MTKLSTPLHVGRLDLSNRIAMAPMTRFRADDNHTPLPMMVEYYAQRASVPGTLLITEATFISPRAGGAANVPGIYTSAQIAAWKEVTSAVHAKGSYIYLQLWALGRVASPEQLKKEGDFQLVSSSPNPITPGTTVPHELTESEIQDWIKDYAQAARNAISAGFDGVEIHGANGYLIDQFNQDTVNTRTDRWGGSVENRARFALEVTRVVVDAVGADRTGIRFSPYSTFQGMRMDDPVPQFSYLASKIAEFKLAYVHVVESRVAGNTDVIGATDQLDFFLEAYGKVGPVIIAGGYKPDSAKEAVDGKYKDYDAIIGIGRPFISNPDLVFRILKGVELVPYNRDTFYPAKDPKGYIDYEFSAEFKTAQVAA